MSSSLRKREAQQKAFRKKVLEICSHRPKTKSKHVRRLTDTEMNRLSGRKY